MTTITLNLGDLPKQGVVIVTPDHIFPTDDKILVTLLKPFIITNGKASMEVPASQSVNGSESISYTWEGYTIDEIVQFFFSDGTEWKGEVTEESRDRTWWTGQGKGTTGSRQVNRVTEESRTLLFKFHAVCPQEDSDFTDLITIPQQTPWLGIGLERLAKIILDDKTNINNIVSNIINWKTDPYDESTQYNTRDAVYYNGSTWLALKDVNQPAGFPEPPPNPDEAISNEYWLLIARGVNNG
ncbi:MAG: hypothetical protein F6K53_20040 [Moorea sp. SIO4A1]|uniref:hypothetical protein n=1 Tax=Moorena sp. SIO4A1 TaxID=2607835 RepID=UPI001418D844|nr:hypothetical protein [Moorena sp. SIO4A1]NEO43309.1 hypothetical protein [Moorena sp. SIO4A3]NEQ59562.1 hypothetical protein [Moorena sp. SIO4A1]